MSGWYLRSLTAVVVAGMMSVCRAEEGDGVDRANLKQWLAGPAKALGKKRAEMDLQAAETMLDSARKSRVDKKLSGLKTETIGKRIVTTYPSAQAKNAAIEKAKHLTDVARERLKEPLPDFPLLFVNNIAVGKIGRLAFHVGDRVDGIVYEVIQIIDENNLIAYLGPDGLRDRTTAWMTMPTQGMVDGKIYSTAGGLFEVVEVKQYATAGGSTRSVFRLMKLTPEDLVRTTPR